MRHRVDQEVGKGASMSRGTAAALLAGILILAAGIRIYNLGDVPAGLFCDEAALGYNAYSILTCGRDEHGMRFPLYVWSFGGYKNPIYIYSATVPIALLGLNEFSLRLTSVFFGLLAVWAAYLLVTEMCDRRGGLAAALFLAVTPWHIHFSRIAFELVSLPPLFLLGFYFFVRGLKRRRNWCWPLSALFFGLCFYAYAPARLQVPLFLLGAAILYAREAWRRKAAFLLSIAVFAITITPSLHFSYKNKARAQRYFKQNSIFRKEKELRGAARIFWRNYRTFFSKEFLFEDQRDPIRRHGVRHFGVYPFYLMPLSLLGALFIVLKRDRNMLLVVLWFLLFPVGASLMDEIPSASRSFMGVPALPVAAGYGVACLMGLAGRIRWRWPVIGIDAALITAVGFFLARDLRLYLDAYFNRYPAFSAGGIYGFQYGYRDVISYMESQRGNYDRLMLTATDVNQPYIFALFYSGIEPEEYLRARSTGYTVLSPKEYGRYSLDGKILYSLREGDLNYFPDYDVKKVIRDPAGTVQFVVAHVKKRKGYITRWMTAGLFDNRRGKGKAAEFIDIKKFDLSDSYKGLYGVVKWKPMFSKFVQADFNRFYARQPTDRRKGNPEDVCVYAVTYVTSPSARDALLEISGSPDFYSVWLNKSAVARNAIARSIARRYPIKLRKGENELLLKSCEGVGDWYLLTRIISPEGSEFEDLDYNSRKKLPVAEGPPAGEIVGEKKAGETYQLVEGFEEIVNYGHTKERYPDVRGGARGWWEYWRENGESLSWETRVCPEKRDTLFVFFGQTGEERGAARLFINGRPVLLFETGLRGDGNWEADGVRLVKRSMGYSAGNCGIYYLKVPAKYIVAGRPCLITVSHERGGRVSWFMIKDYRDNADHETVESGLIVPPRRE